MRPIWSGAISFGLVSVLVPRRRSRRSLRFDFLHRKDLIRPPTRRFRGDDWEPADPGPAKKEEEGEVVALMATLRESVERTTKQRNGTSKRKAS